MATQELQTSRRIVVDEDKAPATLGTEASHLERGQALFRSVLVGIPRLTVEAGYATAQGLVVDNSLGLIRRQTSADMSDGYVYRASTGNNKSLARIRNPLEGVYELIGEGPLKLSELDTQLKRKILTPEQYAEQRKLAEPLGRGTGDFEEFIAGIYAIEPKLFGRNKWEAIFRATHSSTGSSLRREASSLGKALYTIGKTALYRLYREEAESGAEDAERGVFIIRYKKDGKKKTITEQVMQLGEIEDPHGNLRLFARVANIGQLNPI